MTTTQHTHLTSRDVQAFGPLLVRLTEAALALLLFALVAGAWLAFFMLAPLDFGPLHGH